MTESKFQFVNPYVKELSFTENKEFQIGEKIQISFDFKTEHEKKDEKGHVELQVSTSEKSINSPFAINIRMASDFRWDKQLPDDAVDSFLQTNAPALLLGYIRPLIAGITNASRFPAYNIPFIDFTKEN